MPIWFLRHGESAANATGVFAGRRIDSPLTVPGRAQAVQAAASVPGDLTWIVSSPLSRATETAAIVRRARGFPFPVEIDDRAGEFDVGSASGMPIRPMTATEMVDEYGAEPPEVFAGRVRSLLDDLALRDGVGLLVSHAGVGRMIQTLLQGRSPSGFRELPLPANASLFLLGSG